MTSVFSTKTFQNYYQNMIEHPQLMDEESAVILKMKEDFSHLNDSHSKIILTPFTRPFWEARKGLKNFEKFTTLFLQNHPLKESDALVLTHALHNFRNQLDEGRFSGALHERLERIEANLIATSTVDRVEGSDTSAQVKKNLNSLIEDQRKNLVKENESFQKLSKRTSLIRKIGNIGMLVFFVGTLIAIPLVFPVIMIMVAAFTASVLSTIISSTLIENKKEVIDLYTNNIEEYSRLKNLTDHPQFKEFASDVENQKKLANPETTLETMKLFEAKLKNDEQLARIKEAK